MKIELKKMSLRGQIKVLAIVNAVVFPLLLLPFLFEGDGLPDKHVLVDVLIKGIFMIWQSVLISSVIVDEFKTKTMMQLYTYPVKKSAIIGSKIMLIVMIMTVFSLVTQAIQHGLFSGASLVLPSLEYSLGLQDIIEVVLTTPLAVMLGMIPLTVGLWMKSTLAPVVTSFFMIAVLGGGGAESGVQLMNNLIAMAIMSLVGLVFIVISIKDVTKKDLIV